MNNLLNKVVTNQFSSAEDRTEIRVSHDRHYLFVCSFNCRSVKSSLPEVSNLCCKHDFVFLQEHWLLPNELDLLNNIHPDFHSHGLSAVDISHDILVGRPYGGTAILYRKCLADKIRLLDSHESRINGIQIDTRIGPLAFFNVYMPTNYGDDASLELYIECLAKLHALMVDTDAVHTIIAGDFNCSPGSRFYKEYVAFAADNNLIKSDIERLNYVFSYVSDDGSKMSWLDHILCSVSIDKLLIDIVVLNEYIVSDHKPVSFDVMCSVDMPTVIGSDNSTLCHQTPVWHGCDNVTIQMYESHLDQMLQHVDIPHDVCL